MGVQHWGQISIGVRLHDRLLGILGCILLNWSVKVFIPEHIISNILINYISITVSYVAFALVIIFSKLSLGKKTKKIIACFSPAVFGVYLIHTQPIIWEHFMREAFAWFVDLDLIIIPFAILICALGIFVSCILVEKIRLIIFDFLRIDKSIKKIADHMEEICIKAINE